MSSAGTPSIDGELIGSFNKKDTFVKPNDGISPIIILLNVRSFPFALVIIVINETFPIGKLDGSKSSNRIIAKRLITVILADRINDNLIIVSFRPRELLMPGGGISNTKLSDLSDLIDLGVLHVSPIGRSTSLNSAHNDT